MQIFEKLFLNEAESSTKPPIIKNDDQNIDKNTMTNANSIKPPDFTKNSNIQDNKDQQSDQNQSQNNLKSNKPTNQINQDDSIEQQDQNDRNDDSDNPMDGEDNQEENFESEEKTDDLFSDLKPDQMDIKTKELKSQFKNINSVITLSIEKINKISRNTYDDKIVEFIVRKLLQLRDYSKDYLIDTFKTKSYLENQVEFQRILITFGMISRLFNNIKIGRFDRREEIKKKNNKLFKIKKRYNNHMIFSRGF